MKRYLVFVIAIMISLSLAGCSLPQKPRTFETDAFSFTIPKGWKTMAEVWGNEAAAGQDHYGLGVQQQVMIQYPAKKGKGKAFFAVASRPLADGEILEQAFNSAYQAANPAVEDAIKLPFTQAGLTGFEITYRRPWGEPWWQFRDIWLEKDGAVYVLSFHAPPSSFDTYTNTFNEIIAGFEFSE